MKRLLPFIPVILLLLFNSCTGANPGIPVDVGTAVANTQMPVMWTPTITSTPDPNEPNILEWVNAGLPSDQLETTLDAKYQAVDVLFTYLYGSPSPIFRIDIRCECMTGAHCCIPERMFVVTIRAMKERADKIIEQVPGNTSQVKVVCYDHTSQLGVMAASWVDARDYLRDNINGYQLGSRTNRSSLP